MVYEDRKTWIARAQRRGFTRRGAERSSHWLLDLPNIERIARSLIKAARGKAVSFELRELNDYLGHFSSRVDRMAGTLVWNITDGVLGFRGSHLVSHAELYGVPYFGCPSFAHHLAQDKFKLYALCASLGIRAPPCALLQNRQVVATCGAFPDGGAYFVKPNSLGNKVGIGTDSLCSDVAQAHRHATELQNLLRDRVIVQSFIAGPEVRLTYINAAGSDDMAFHGLDVVDEHLEGDHFVGFRDRERKYRGYVDFREWRGYDADRKDRALRAMTDAVRLLGQHVRLKDYFAIDFRLDAAGNAFLLDFNPGAFLYGDEIDGYTRMAFQLPLPDALLRAMELSHRTQCAKKDLGNVVFRL